MTFDAMHKKVVASDLKLATTWCTGAIQIRTGDGGAQGKRALHFTKIYSFSSVLIIE